MENIFWVQWGGQKTFGEGLGAPIIKADKSFVCFHLILFFCDGVKVFKWFYSGRFFTISRMC